MPGIPNDATDEQLTLALSSRDSPQSGEPLRGTFPACA
jgi:hypothetical protein